MKSIIEIGEEQDQKENQFTSTNIINILTSEMLNGDPPKRKTKTKDIIKKTDRYLKLDDS